MVKPDGSVVTVFCDHRIVARGYLKYSEVPQWFVLFWLFGKKVRACLECPAMKYFGKFD